MKKEIIIALCSIVFIVLIIFCIYYNNKTIVNMESKTLVKLYVNRGGTIKDFSCTGKCIFVKKDFKNKKVSEAPEIIIKKEKENNLLDKSDTYEIAITIDSESDKKINKYKKMISDKKTIKLNEKETIELEYESCTCENIVCKKSC